nr:hypothetical protein Iba_chr10dCG2540 [Ipomoea batatas]
MLPSNIKFSTQEPLGLKLEWVFPVPRVSVDAPDVDEEPHLCSLLVPIIESSSCDAFSMVSGWFISSASAHSTVMADVSVPAANMSSAPTSTSSPALALCESRARKRLISSRLTGSRSRARREQTRSPVSHMLSNPQQLMWGDRRRNTRESLGTLWPFQPTKPPHKAQNQAIFASRVRACLRGCEVLGEVSGPGDGDGR